MDSKENKMEKLVNSYETLMKGNFEKNSSIIGDVIGKISKYDLNIAVEMWKNLLKTHKDDLNDEEFGFRLTWGVGYEIEKEVGYDEWVKIFKNNADIMELYFSISSYCDDSAITKCLKNSDYDIAIKMFDYIYNKDLRYDDVGNVISKNELIIRILSYFSLDQTYLSKEAIEILEMWIDKISEEELKAKADLYLIKLQDIYDDNTEADNV